MSQEDVRAMRSAKPDGPYWFSPAQRAGSVACCVGIASVTTHSRPAWATELLVRLRSRSGQSARVGLQPVPGNPPSSMEMPSFLFVP
jgi:hypothetical protein